MRTALLAGATGLVGSRLLRVLAEREGYERVLVLLRRPLAFEHPRVLKTVLDFERLPLLEPRPVTDVYCALGTTIRKAGSQEAFRRVDYDYPLALARWAAAMGAERLMLVSSVGADPKSLSFYLKVKGEIEEAVCALPFRAVHCFRPSVLLGPRSEWRPGEMLGKLALRLGRNLLLGRRRIYRAMPADLLAPAMVEAAWRGGEGRLTHHYDEIVALARA